MRHHLNGFQNGLCFILKHSVQSQSAHRRLGGTNEMSMPPIHQPGADAELDNRQQSTYEASLAGFFGKPARFAHDFRPSGGRSQFDNAGKDDNGFLLFSCLPFCRKSPMP